MADLESTPIAFPADRDAAFAQSDALITGQIRARWACLGRTILVGLSGTQASGKSHTAARLAEQLGHEGIRVAVRSLDDFYLTRAERQHLATSVHPLLKTRGVPGTHDFALIQETFGQLSSANDDARTPLASNAYWAGVPSRRRSSNALQTDRARR